MQATVLCLLLSLALAFASVTQVTQSTCDGFKSFLNTRQPGDSDADFQRNRNTATLVSLQNDSSASGVCAGFSVGQKSCCSAETGKFEFDHLLQEIQGEWSRAFSDVSLPSIFDATKPSDIMMSSPGSGGDNELFGFIDDYAAARATKSESDATVRLNDAVLDYFAEFYGSSTARAYCGPVGNNNAPCACTTQTWAAAAAGFSGIINFAKSLAKMYQVLAEALFQLIRGFKGFKAVFTIAANYVPSEDCARYVFAETRCQYCYGLFEADPCEQLCYGRQRVCYGALVDVVDPIWRRSLDVISGAFTRLQTLASSESGPGSLVSCPTCSEFRSLVAIAADECPAANITIEKSGFCGSNSPCNENKRRALFELPQLDLPQVKDISSAVSSMSRRASSSVSVSTDPFAEMKNLFTNLLASLCDDDDSYSNATTCWKGSVDVQNNNRAALVAGVAAKKTALKQSIANSTDSDEKAELQDQLDGLTEAQAAADFGVFGASASYTVNKSAVLADSNLAAELDALTEASEAAAGSSASSVVVSAALLIAATLFSFVMF